MELEKVYSSMFFLLQFVMSFYRNKRISIVNVTHQLPCLKMKLVHSALLCIWSIDKKQICQTQCMELFIVTYQGGVLLPRNVIDGLQPLESNKYQVEFDPGRRELVSTCEKIKVLHKIIINLH